MRGLVLVPVGVGAVVWLYVAVRTAARRVRVNRWARVALGPQAPEVLDALERAHREVTDG